MPQLKSSVVRQFQLSHVAVWQMQSGGQGVPPLPNQYLLLKKKIVFNTFRDRPGNWQPCKPVPLGLFCHLLTSVFFLSTQVKKKKNQQQRSLLKSCTLEMRGFQTPEKLHFAGSLVQVDNLHQRPFDLSLLSFPHPLPRLTIGKVFDPR